jgi:hypothetical protein
MLESEDRPIISFHNSIYLLEHLHIAFIFVRSSSRYGSQRMFLCEIFVNMEMGTGYVVYVGRSLSLNDTNDELGRHCSSSFILRKMLRIRRDLNYAWSPGPR